MPMRNFDRRAFTALELIIVVIIIGILASMGISKYKNFTVTARKNACISNQEQITAAIRLAENDLGPLSSNSILRMYYDGTIDSTHCVLAPAQNNTSYNIWIGFVPNAWGVTVVTAPTPRNSTILSKAQEMKLFRCPQDSSDLTPSYTGIQSFTSGSPCSDPWTYTFAKLYNDSLAGYARGTVPAAAPALSPSNDHPLSTSDPLEGYNWLVNSLEWRNTSFTFCRRWGGRDPIGAGAAPAGTTADYYYVPAGQERRLAHSAYAPQN